MTRSSAHHLRDAQDLQHFTDGAVDEIRRGLERGDPPPLGEEAAGEICVFVSGHTHAPSLTHFGQAGALVNSGCWLRQLQPIAARFGAPPVFFSRFVQTHVRVYRTTVGLEVELWEHLILVRRRNASSISSDSWWQAAFRPNPPSQRRACVSEARLSGCPHCGSAARSVRGRNLAGGEAGIAAGVVEPAVW
jgi:hypothetical protein